MEKPDGNLDFYLYQVPRKKGRPIWYVKFRDPVSREILPGRSSRETNETRARDWARLEYEKRAGTDARPQIFVKDFTNSFYSDDCAYVRKQRSCKGMSEKTRKQKRRYVEEYILKDDTLMSLRLADVTRRDVERFRDDYLVGERFEDEPCRTSQAIMEVVKTIFGQAIMEGLVLQNPVFRLSTGKYDKQERIALSEGQLDDLLRRENFGSDRQYHATMIAACTGMRAGEVRGLRWMDIAPKARIIHIERALANESSTVQLPKWGKRRVCPYPKSLSEILEPLRAAAKPEDFVFAWEEDGVLNYRRWKDNFYRACAKAVEKRVERDREAGRDPDLTPIDCTLHGLRHTLNTILLQRGIPDAVIRAALGWSDPKIQQRYTHISFGNQYRSPIIDSVVEVIRGETGSN